MIARWGTSHRTSLCSSHRGAGGRLRAGPGAAPYIQLVATTDTAMERATLQKTGRRGGAAQRKGSGLPYAQAAHLPVWNWALATDNSAAPHLPSSQIVWHCGHQDADPEIKSLINRGPGGLEN